MADYDPIESFIRIAAALRSLSEQDPIFAERVRRQAELYKQMAIAEPSSLRREIEQMHAQPGLSADFVRHFLEIALEIPRPPSDDFDFCPSANDLFHFFRRGVEGSSPQAINELISAALNFDMGILRAALIEAMQPDPSASFERRTRVLSDVLKNTAENWYKPILKCALKVSYRVRGRTDAIVPDELGALMGACRDSHDVPLSILSDHVRIIRNSVAHSQAHFDLVNLTVTFVNQNRRGVRETLGPISWDQLKEISDQFLELCWALSLVCRRQRRLTANRDT
ncbi:hypothetical protein WMF30_40425 [Sorangium sp. So ce134]